MRQLELDAILEAAQAAGLVEVYEQDGEEMMKLTPEGEKSAVVAVEVAVLEIVLAVRDGDGAVPG